ncbi:hypothetical protein IWQ51_003557 [Labrenzia sp. EL_142]|nr:hypothetical protein [Labrenzia sp. EL_142]
MTRLKNRMRLASGFFSFDWFIVELLSFLHANNVCRGTTASKQKFWLLTRGQVPGTVQMNPVEWRLLRFFKQTIRR